MQQNNISNLKKEDKHMLKKSIKKFIALTLATVTVATGSTAVSASTLTPKKSHSEAQITEYVDYFNEITDRYAFRPDGYVPLYIDGTHDSQLYDSWQMTKLLQNTPGITSEQKADMKKAADTWKKAYLSERMVYIYWVKWSRMYSYIDDKVSLSQSTSWAPRCKAYAQKMYNETNTYISGKSKYNPKLANELRKFNKQRLNIYNKAIDTWFYKMTKKQRAKWGSNIISGGANGHSYALMTSYVSHCLTKNKMTSNPYYLVGIDSVDAFGRGDNYAWGTLKLNPFNGSKDAPNTVWNRHIQWKKW